MATGTIPKIKSYTSGTDGLWTYRKFDDHTYHAWFAGGVNLSTGTAFVGGYYHPTKSSLTPPSFSQSVTSLIGGSNSPVLCAYLGHASDYATYWLNGTASEVNNVPVRLDMYGTW